MNKLSEPMQDVLTVIGFHGKRGAASLPSWVKSNTTKALVSRGLIEHRFTSDGERWMLTDAGLTAAKEIAAPEIAGDAKQEANAALVAAALEEERTRVIESLPTVPGYSWRWFNPQGGEPISESVVQLMADGEDLTPSAKLMRNVDGTWRLESGPRWGISAILAGSWQRSLSMEECALAAALIAHEKGVVRAQLELLDQAREEDESLAYSEELATVTPGAVGKLCKVKRSAHSRRAKWRKVR